jgi:hypothetical protein
MMTEQQRERFSGAIDRLAGDEGMFLKVAAIASEDAPKLIHQSESELSEHKFENAAASIHKLKGLLATFVSPDHNLRLDDVMKAVKADDRENAAEQWQAVKPNLHSLVAEINSLPFR